MLDFELNHLNESPEWRTILEEYQHRENLQKTADPESDGWVLRISSLEDINEEELPKIHGKLIAVGYLKFQLSGRNSGVKYQISPAGKLALKNKPVMTSHTEEEDPLKKSA